jgi:hypothetical protein
MPQYKVFLTIRLPEQPNRIMPGSVGNNVASYDVANNYLHRVVLPVTGNFVVHRVASRYWCDGLNGCLTGSLLIVRDLLSVS